MQFIKHRVIAPKPYTGVKITSQTKLEAAKLFHDHKVIGVEIIDGFPSGPNNDEFRIIFDNGKTVCIDSYSTGAEISVGSADDQVEGE
jgi:hypothetical protein